MNPFKDMRSVELELMQIEIEEKIRVYESMINCYICKVRTSEYRGIKGYMVCKVCTGENYE